MNSIIGAAVGLGLNIILVPIYKSVGSAFVWICSELAVLFVAQYFVSKKLEISFPFKKILINVIYSIPIVLLCLFLKTITDISDIILLCIACCSGVLYFGCIQVFLVKNELVLSILLRLLHFVKR